MTTTIKQLRMFGREIPYREHVSYPNWYRDFDKDWPFIVSVSKQPGEGYYFSYVKLHLLMMRSHEWNGMDVDPGESLARVEKAIKDDMTKLMPWMTLVANLTGVPR